MRARLRYIDENPDTAAVDEFNRATRNQLMVNNNVRPCFFTGNIQETGKIVTISLNPRYTPNVTEEEQQNMTFDQWYDFCKNRFAEYSAPGDVHTVFRNLWKVIIPINDWRIENCRADLQRKLINLDWCPYYSQYFRTFEQNGLGPRLIHWINTVWDETLAQLLNQCKPLCVFVHGRSMQTWVNEHCRDLVLIRSVRTRNNQCGLWQGTLQDIRMFYLEHFINNANSNATLNEIGGIVRSAIKAVKGQPSAPLNRALTSQRRRD